MNYDYKPGSLIIVYDSKDNTRVESVYDVQGAYSAPGAVRVVEMTSRTQSAPSVNGKTLDSCFVPAEIMDALIESGGADIYERAEAR